LRGGTVSEIWGIEQLKAKAQLKANMYKWSINSLRQLIVSTVIAWMSLHTFF
jgi:hypothetical protein